LRIARLGWEEMEGFTARVKYHKAGIIRLLGHLDTARALLRAVRRAGIEGVYSEGFSPRLRLSFGPPIPLGCTSECEYFDIRLARKCEPESVKEALQAHMPEGLVVEEVQILEGNVPPLSAAFRAVEYEVEPPQDWRPNREKLDLPRWNKRSPASGSYSMHDLGILHAQWQEMNDGKRLLSLVLRRSASGGVRLKEAIGHLLGIGPGELHKVRIHKKRVYPEGEQP